MLGSLVGTGLMALAMIGPLGPMPPGQVHLAAPPVAADGVGVVQPVGMTDVVDMSKDGRYVLGRLGGRYVVRDVVRGRTVRRLPSGDEYAYHGLSDSGRYVVYTRTRPGSPTTCGTPYVRDRVTNRVRNAATTASGARLPAGWTPTGTECPDEPSWRTQITFSAPAISGNGRYVAFCVNLAVPDRLDLYVKDLRTRRIRTFEGVCSEITDAFERPAAPQVSETARVILLPGRDATGDEAGYHSWWPASLLLNRSTLVAGVGGAGPVLTADGSAVYSVGPLTCLGGEVPCPGGPIRYDVSSATTAALPAGDPGPGPTTRRGRYVVVTTNDPVGNRLAVLDRATGTSTDLTPAFVGAGVAIPTWFFPPRPDVPPRTLVSGDGRIVMVSPDGSADWYRLRWM
jgi:hypothetical protein